MSRYDNDHDRTRRSGRTSRRGSSRPEDEPRNTDRATAEDRARRRRKAERGSNRAYSDKDNQSRSNRRGGQHGDRSSRRAKSADSRRKADTRESRSTRSRRYPNDVDAAWRQPPASRGRGASSSAAGYGRRDNPRNGDARARRLGGDSANRKSGKNRSGNRSGRRLDNRPLRSDRDFNPKRNPKGGYSRRNESSGGNLTILIVALIAITVIVLLASMIGKHITKERTPEEDPVYTTIQQQVTSHVNSCLLSNDEIVKRLEDQGVEDKWAKEAASLSETDRRFMLLAQRSDKLGREGAEITNKLVKLAVNDPEAVNYVVDYIDKYPAEEAEPYTDTVTKGIVPRLYQWDERWAYVPYSSTSLGCSGCAPTSLSMVYMGVTGKSDMSPADMAKLSTQDGFETDFDGTMSEFVVAEAEALGMKVTQLDLDADALAAALNEGTPVICNVGPGDFTLHGHFFVITGINEDGTININDPFSSVNSSKSWDVDLILGQTISLYSYKSADAKDDDDETEGEEGSEDGNDEVIAEDESTDQEYYDEGYYGDSGEYYVEENA